jgi:hypothetical protein
MPASATANSRLFGEGAAPLHQLLGFTDQLHMLPGRIEWRGVNLDLDYMKIANVANSFFK